MLYKQTLDYLGKDKHSSLLRTFVNYSHKKLGPGYLDWLEVAGWSNLGLDMPR
jgi:hypothetical protein